MPEPTTGPVDLDGLLGLLDDAIFVLSPDWRYSYVNRAAARLFRSSEKELIGRCIWTLFPQTAASDLRPALERALEEKVFVELDSVFVPDSEWYNVRAQPYAGGTVVRVRDTTQRKQKESELRGLARVFRDAADPIFILDLDGIVLEMNDDAERAFRCSRDAVVGKPITELVPVRRRQEMLDLVSRCRRGEYIRNVESDRRRANGEVFPALTTISLITDEEGNATAFAAMIKDISELKRTERELQMQRAHLAEQARLTTVSELAAGLAHELNQPLAAIGHYCDAALSVTGESNSELTKLIREAYDQTLRAGDIIRNLRGLISREVTERSRENINELIRVTSRFLRAEIRSNKATLTLALTDGLPHTTVNKVEIQQVLTNLILNSLEAMENACSPLRHLTIATALVDRDVRVTVRDTGPGVDNEIEAELFDPFRTGKPENLGLGLWISQSILRNHDGQIWTENVEGGGAMFHFSLPVNRE